MVVESGRSSGEEKGIHFSPSILLDAGAPIPPYLVHTMSVANLLYVVLVFPVHGQYQQQATLPLAS